MDQPRLIVPKVYTDGRGWFAEIWRANRYPMVQCNHSFSVAGTLRGMHYQATKPQAKLIRCIRGVVFDVVIDIRQESKCFGAWQTNELSASNRYQLYIPPGFAHGFLALEDSEIEYMVSDYYSPEDERVIIWNDATLGIPWPLTNPILSNRDAKGAPFSEVCYANV